MASCLDCGGPTTTQRCRSCAKKLTWQDPGFRARWPTRYRTKPRPAKTKNSCTDCSAPTTASRCRSCGNRLAWQDPGRRAKLAEQLTPERRARAAEQTRLRWTDPDYRGRLVEIHKEQMTDPERRKVAGNARRGKPWSEEERAKHLAYEPTEQTRQKLREARAKRVGPNNPTWKGGRHVVRGYVMIYAPGSPMANRGGYVPEHRLVMAELVGRPLESHEDVHHINGDRADNAPKNLKLMGSKSEHTALHWQEGKGRSR